MVLYYVGQSQNQIPRNIRIEVNDNRTVVKKTDENILYYYMSEHCDS